MGPGPGTACAITLNSALAPREQALYQDPRVIQELLRNSRTIAIVGLSSDPQRASWFVASYLKKEGYRVIPVNPKAERILGEVCYPDLASTPSLSIWSMCSVPPPSASRWPGRPWRSMPRRSGSS
jgi:hypothetical protein